MACQADIQQQANTFLDYDSFIDCRTVYIFEEKQLTDLQGTLSDETQHRLLSTVKQCKTIERKYKKIILNTNRPNTTT